MATQLQRPSDPAEGIEAMPAMIKLTESGMTATFSAFVHSVAMGESTAAALSADEWPWSKAPSENPKMSPTGPKTLINLAKRLRDREISTRSHHTERSMP